MSDLKCHYCGAECKISTTWVPKFCVRCKRQECLAEGPLFDTPEAARAAHARVMPVPVWTTETVVVGGWFWVMGSTGQMVDIRHMDPEGVRLLLAHGCKIAGPLEPPPSAEPVRFDRLGVVGHRKTGKGIIAALADAFAEPAEGGAG